MGMKNAIEQAKKEVGNRFDFKGVMVEILFGQALKIYFFSLQKCKFNARPPLKKQFANFLDKLILS